MKTGALGGAVSARATPANIDARRAGPARDVGGLQVTPVAMFVKDEYVAHIPGLLVYAVGEQGLASLLALARRQRGQAVAPAPMRRLRPHAPAGFNLAATVPLRMFEERFGQSILWEVWREFRGELPPAARPGWSRDQFEDEVKKLLPLLEKRGFARIDVMGGFRKTPKNSVSSLRIVW